MANNAITISSASVATDDVGGIHYQRMKLVNGAEDSSEVIEGSTAYGLEVDVTRVAGTVAVSGPLTDAALRASAVSVTTNGLTDTQLRATTVGILQDRVTTATVTAVAASATVVTLSASAAARRGLILENNAAQVLYIKYGSGATTATYTATIPASGGYWEMPFPIYTGIVTGIWAGADAGKVMVTEL